MENIQQQVAYVAWWLACCADETCGKYRKPSSMFFPHLFPVERKEGRMGNIKYRCGDMGGEASSFWDWERTYWVCVSSSSAPSSSSSSSSPKCATWPLGEETKGTTAGELDRKEKWSRGFSSGGKKGGVVERNEQRWWEVTTGRGWRQREEGEGKLSKARFTNYLTSNPRADLKGLNWF